MARLASTLGWLVGGLHLLLTFGALVLFLSSQKSEFGWVPLAIVGLPWSIAYISLTIRTGLADSHVVNTVVIVLLAVLNAGLLYLVASWIEAQWKKGRETKAAAKRLFCAGSIGLATAALFSAGVFMWTYPLGLYRHALWPGFAAAQWLLGEGRHAVPVGVVLNVMAWALVPSVLSMSIWSLRDHDTKHHAA